MLPHCTSIRAQVNMAFIPVTLAPLSRAQLFPTSRSARPRCKWGIPGQDVVRQPLACVSSPPPNGDPRRDDECESKSIPSVVDMETEASLDDIVELDHLAEEWIGSDLARWEWYERLKSRRARLLAAAARNETRLNEEFDTLRRTLMDFDSVFGTTLLDGQSNVSPTGWGVLVTIMMLYVGLGYAALHVIVSFAMSSGGTGFPMP